MIVNLIALSWLLTAFDAGRVERPSRFALQELTFFRLRYKTLHTQRSRTPKRMALLDTGGRTPGCVLNYSPSFFFNHNKYLCDFVSQITPASVDAKRGAFFATVKKVTLFTVNWMQLHILSQHEH